MPRKVFTAGEVLAAADVNEFLMDQAVQSFAGTAARGSAIPSPVEGMTTYLEDSDSVEIHNGTSFVQALPIGEWTSFTPTWTNLTVGNGSYIRSAYALYGKTAFVNVRFVLGSTSSVTGNATMTVPSLLARKTQSTILNTVSMFDTGTANYVGVALSNPNAQEFSIRHLLVSGTSVQMAATSATAPFTWTNTDIFDISLSYEVA